MCRRRTSAQLRPSCLAWRRVAYPWTLMVGQSRSWRKRKGVMQAQHPSPRQRLGRQPPAKELQGNGLQMVLPLRPRGTLARVAVELLLLQAGVGPQLPQAAA